MAVSQERLSDLCKKKGYMWKIKRPKVEWYRKAQSLFTAFTFTLLGCFLFYVKGNKYYLIGVAMGVLAILIGLFCKADDNTNSEDKKHQI